MVSDDKNRDPHTTWQRMASQRTHDVIITSLLRQNDAAASLWHNNDAIFTSSVRWEIQLFLPLQQIAFQIYSYHMTFPRTMWKFPFLTKAICNTHKLVFKAIVRPPEPRIHFTPMLQRLETAVKNAKFLFFLWLMILIFFFLYYRVHIEDSAIVHKELWALMISLLASLYNPIVNPAMVSTVRFYDRNELYGSPDVRNCRMPNFLGWAFFVISLISIN